jgi:3'-5' exonuclease
MSIIVLDIETYYSAAYSLSKLTTEEYLHSPEFQVIGVGIKVDDGKPYWVTEDIEQELNKLDWDGSALVCHNTMFDAAILAWKYNIRPAFYFDTMLMARALNPPTTSVSLANLARQYHCGIKGDEVIRAMGIRKEYFHPEALAQYGGYCMNDVAITYNLFNTLSCKFPDLELNLIDLTLRMFLTPVLEVDNFMLVDKLDEIQATKTMMLSGLMKELKCEDTEAVRKVLSSNPQFAQALINIGVNPPLKVRKFMRWLKLMKTSWLYKSIRTFLCKNSAVCVWVQNRRLKKVELAALLMLQLEIEDDCQYHLNITGHIPVDGPAWMQLTSRISQAGTQARRRLRMRSMPPKGIPSLMQTCLKSKRVYWHGGLDSWNYWTVSAFTTPGKVPTYTVCLQAKFIKDL